MQVWGRRSIGVLAVLALLAALATMPAAAQEEDTGDEDIPEDTFDQYLDDSEIGAGSCSPDALSGSTLTDCRFPLTGEGWEFWSGPTNQVAMVEDFQFAVSAPCVIEDTELVCRDLKVPSYRDTFRVNLSGYFLEDRRPTITIDREFDSVIGIIQTVHRLKTVFAGGTLTLEVFRAGSLDDDAPVEVHLRRPGSEEVLSRASALAPGEQDGSFSLQIPEPGRYEFVSCAVDTDGTCFRTGIPTAIEALDAQVEELVEGLNNPEDERINIVFVGTGYESGEALKAHATTMLALDGEPIPVGDFGKPVDPEDAEFLIWGTFAIEPMNEHVDKFNFWYLPTISTGSPISVSPTSIGPDGVVSSEINLDDLGLGPHVAIVNMTTWTAIDGTRATGELPSFTTWGTTFDPKPAALEDPIPVDNSDIRFGSIFLPIFDPGSVNDAVVLAHEFGHTLFGLRDEYEEFEQELPTIGRPNCAIDQADAEALWGDLVGEVDPMFDRWADTMTDAGFDDFINATRDEVTVGYVEGGCFAGQGAVRPTTNSLMNGNIPVFGAVNREQVQAVLDLWPEPTPVTTTTTAPPTTLAPSSVTTEPSSDSSEIAVSPVDDPDSPGGGLGWLIPASIGIVGLAILGVVRARRRTRNPANSA